MDDKFESSVIHKGTKTGKIYHYYRCGLRVV